jgi:hypothetical protein
MLNLLPLFLSSHLTSHILLFFSFSLSLSYLALYSVFGFYLVLHLIASLGSLSISDHMRLVASRITSPTPSRISIRPNPRYGPLRQPQLSAVKQTNAEEQDLKGCCISTPCNLPDRIPSSLPSAT